MYQPEDNDPIEQTNNVNAEGSSPDNTDRVNGEYHYKNGFTQKIYSDAHYVPADESNDPPRYYTPPEKQEKPQREPKPSDNGGHGKKHGYLRFACIALVCALLGGLCGGAIAESRLNSRITALEDSVNAEPSETPVVSASSAPIAASSSGSSSDSLSWAEINEIASKQVVGVTTEVTYTNFFGQTSSSAVSGSGFVITDDGYILTNYHVIETAYQNNYAVNVITHDGTRYDATIVGIEASNDIAVLKIDATGLTPATLGNSDSLAVGDDVCAVGNPLGELEFTSTFGHVSALDRLITTEEGGSAINMFQIDAAVNSGNSGGPVYNTRGEVIGIVTAKYSSSGVEGLGFAIPINDAASIANDLITKGYVTGKAHMGVRIDQRYTSAYSQYYNMPEGAYVYSVESGSCAETAGLRAGDIITKLGESEVKSYTDLTHAVKQYSAGDTAELVIYRAGETLTLSITFDEEVPENTSGSTSIMPGQAP